MLTKKIASTSTPAFLSLLLIFLVARSGIELYGRIDSLLDFGAHFPMSDGSYKSASLWGPLAFHFLHLRGALSWYVLHGLLTAATLGLGLYAACRNASSRADARTAIVLFAACGIPTVLCRSIGHYDLYTLLGAILLGSFEPPLVAFAAGVLLGGNNAEQAIVTTTCWLLTSTALAGKFPVKKSSALLLGVVAGSLLLSGIRLNAEAHSSRSQLLFAKIKPSLAGSLASGTWLIWSGFGAAWLFAISEVFSLEGRRRWLCFAGLIGLPLGLTFVTLDGTRVFVCCSSAAFLTAIRWEVRRGEGLSTWGATTALLMFLTPPLYTWVGGELRPPWGQMIEIMAPGARRASSGPKKVQEKARRRAQVTLTAPNSDSPEPAP